MIASQGWAFGRLCLQRGLVPYKRDPRELASPSFLPHEVIMERQLSMKQKWALTQHLPPELLRHKFLLFISCAVYTAT
jgi:hypothetical protein